MLRPLERLLRQAGERRAGQRCAKTERTQGAGLNQSVSFLDVPVRRSIGRLPEPKTPAYVLHCFQKKTQKTSKADIDLAASRYRDLARELGR